MPSDWTLDGIPRQKRVCNRYARGPAASKDGMARTSGKTFHSIPGSGLTSTGFPANMAIMTFTPLAPTDKTAARAKTPT